MSLDEFLDRLITYSQGRTKWICFPLDNGIQQNWMERPFQYSLQIKNSKPFEFHEMICGNLIR